jgi:hypothetical protein
MLFPLYKLVQACGSEIDPYDYYPQFFRPEATRQPAFVPYYYTAQTKYYDQRYEYRDEDASPDANIRGWRAYTGSTVPPTDLEAFIYTSPYTELKKLYDHLEKNQPLQISRVTAGNAFTKWFKDSKDLEALGYLMYAKQCEPHVTASDDWEMPVRDTAKMGRLLGNGLQLHAAAKKDFIRERYAFQVLRLALYGGRYAQVLELYPKLVREGPQVDSAIYTRSLGLKAGALFRTGQKTKAAYIYSRVFDLSDNQKLTSYISFDWATTADVSPVLALCKNQHERAVVHVMDGLNNFEQALPDIKAAYAADPAVRGLDVLFSREINKLEERYLQDKLLEQRGLRQPWGYGHYEGEWQEGTERQEVADRWKDYASALNDFAKKAAAEGKTGHKAFWQLSGAYLYFIMDDAENSRRLLDLAKSTGMSPGEKQMYDVINALNIIRRNGGMTAKAEKELLPFMESLDSRSEKSPAARKLHGDLLSTVIATSYLQRRDTARAIFALAKGAGSAFNDFTDLPGVLLEGMTIAELRKVQDFLRQPRKSPWDAWLTSGRTYTVNDLVELEGTKYLRLHQFGKAAEVLAGVSPAPQREYLLPDPFLARVSDIMELEARDTAHWYTKLAFARKMDSLSRRGDAAGLFAYGCGLYSMTYYGKAHHAYDYYRSSTDGLAYYNGRERQALPEYEQDFYGAVSAEQAFVRAGQKSGDPELSAKCIWMAAKCWQKRCPPSNNDNNAYYHNSLKNPYFEQFGQASSTAFMREAQNTCSYFRDFIKANK